MGGFSMQTKTFVLAAALAALFGLTNVVSAQFGPAGGMYGNPALGLPGPYGVAQMGANPYGAYGAPSSAMAAAYQPQPEPEGGPATASMSCSEPACGCEGNGGGGCG